MIRQLDVSEYGKHYTHSVACQQAPKLLGTYPALSVDDIQYLIEFGHALTMPECYVIQGRKPPSNTSPADTFKYAQSVRLHRQMRLLARSSVIDNLLENHTVSYILLDLLSDPDADTELLSKLLLKEMYVGA